MVENTDAGLPASANDPINTCTFLAFQRFQPSVMMAAGVRDRVLVESSRRIIWSAGPVFDSGDMGLKRRGFVLEWHSPRVIHFARAIITIPG